MWGVSGVSMIGGLLLVEAKVEANIFAQAAADARLGLGAGAIVGIVAGAALFARAGPSRNAALLAGVAAALLACLRASDLVARIALAVIALGLAVPFALHEIRALRRRKTITAARAAAAVVVAAPWLLLAPALLGDPAPARAALALALGAGALASAVVAMGEARNGQSFGVSVWSGGLGGGRGGFSVSRPLAMLLLALSLAGAAAGVIVGPGKTAPESAAPAKPDKKGEAAGETGKTVSGD